MSILSPHFHELAGTVVSFTGLLVYFAVIPGLVDLSAYESSSLLLYVTLDAYLLFRLVILLRASTEPVWRRLYGWLLATTALWLLSDLLEMLMWAEFVA